MLYIRRSVFQVLVEEGRERDEKRETVSSVDGETKRRTAAGGWCRIKKLIRTRYNDTTYTLLPVLGVVCSTTRAVRSDSVNALEDPGGLYVARGSLFVVLEQTKPAAGENSQPA